MTAGPDVLGALSRFGRPLLVAGLVCGLAFPAAGAVLQPWLTEMIAGLLFLAALRVGPQGLRAVLGRPVETAATVLVYQLALPVSVALVVLILGVAGHPAALVLVLVTAAAPLAGSPNLAVMTGGAPGPALGLLILGTAALPFTVLPVFALSDAFGSAQAVWGGAARLLALIALAALAVALLHGRLMRGPRAVARVDGLSALLMTVVVVGLMGASAEALRETPLDFVAWLAFACAVNFGLQSAVAVALRGPGFDATRIPLSIVAGNRNIALFLLAMPPETAAQIMLFIGCYQIPMYLTPYAMAGLHRRLGSRR